MSSYETLAPASASSCATFCAATIHAHISWASSFLALRENIVWGTDVSQNHGTSGPFQGCPIYLLGCQNECEEADWVWHGVLSPLMLASVSSAIFSQPWCCQTQLVSLLYHPQYPTGLWWWGMPPFDISSQHNLNQSVLRKSRWLAWWGNYFIQPDEACSIHNLPCEPTSIQKGHCQLSARAMLSGRSWVEKCGRLARFARDMLLSEARWVHGWDLASMYVLCLLWRSVYSGVLSLYFGGRDGLGFREGEREPRDRDVTW